MLSSSKVSFLASSGGLFAFPVCWELCALLNSLGHESGNKPYALLVFVSIEALVTVCWELCALLNSPGHESGNKPYALLVFVSIEALVVFDLFFMRITNIVRKINKRINPPSAAKTATAKVVGFTGAVVSVVLVLRVLLERLTVSDPLDGDMVHWEVAAE